MQIGRIVGTTRVLGKSQGYIGLPVKDITLKDPTDGLTIPGMESAWLLGTDEIHALLLGAPIVLRVLGDGHPPVSLYVDKGRLADVPSNGAERVLPCPHPLGAKVRIAECSKYAADWRGWTGFVQGVKVGKHGLLDYTVCDMLPDEVLTDGFAHEDLEVIW